jgi:two-component system, chemotaxis family, protein-glutamate methylesterase/glutaminase
MNRIRTIKTLVVDDSAFNRSAISHMLAVDTGIEVVGTAIDGVDAIGKTLRLAPDVITLDLEMPNMDGFTFLRWLMKERPTPVLVISSRSDSRSVFRAMELGAVDFLAKPEARISKSLEGIREELLMKVRAMPLLEMGKVRSTVDLLARERDAPVVRKDEEIIPRKSVIEIVAIAASTGGPPALQAILSGLPGDLGAGIVIAQHMPPGFTRSFAERLNKLAPLIVSEAAAGDRIRPGMALIAPGGHHLLVKRDREGLFVELVPREPSDKYVPSADRMMASVADACGPAVLGVVLTGMGNDGTAGALAIKRLNGLCIAESKESAVIFGMPQEVIRSGAVDKVLPLSRMADEISFRCSGRA